MVRPQLVDRMIAEEQLEAARRLGQDEASILAALEELDPWAWTKTGEVAWKRMASRFGWSRQRMNEARNRLVDLGRRLR